MRSVLLFPLLCLLVACSTPTKTVPEALLQACPHPAVAVSNNGELSRALLAYSKALDECNDDKAALRKHLSPPGLKLL